MPKRIRPASIYQRADSKMRVVAMAFKRAIKRDLKGSLALLGRDLDTEKAVQMGRAGLWGQIAHEAIDWRHFREVLKAVFDRIATCYETGARLGVDRINAAHRRRGQRVRFGKKEGPGGPGPVKGGMPPRGDAASLDELFDLSKAVADRFNFDRFDPGTQAWLKAEQDRLIADLEDQARSTISTVVLDTVRAGQTPAQSVETIQSVIGLTDTQAKAVLNYRRMVGELDPGALARQLRSTQYDAAYKRAMEDGTALGDELVDEMVQAYAENYLAYRADTIAQTEAVRASNAGLQDSYEQAIERGALPAEAVRQYWKVSMLENTCEICLSIPDMNPDGVAVGDEFASIDGPQDAPPIHPRCLCELEFITDLDLVPED